MLRLGYVNLIKSCSTTAIFQNAVFSNQNYNTYYSIVANATLDFPTCFATNSKISLLSDRSGEVSGIDGQISRTADLHGYHVGLHGDTVGLHGDTVGLHGDTVDLHGDTVDLHGGTVGLHGGTVGLHGGTVGLHGGTVGLHDDNASLTSVLVEFLKSKSYNQNHTTYYTIFNSYFY